MRSKDRREPPLHLDERTWTAEIPGLVDELVEFPPFNTLDCRLAEGSVLEVSHVIHRKIDRN
jgi:hypothetical protein